jgi:hypothetical protein
MHDAWALDTNGEIFTAEMKDKLAGSLDTTKDGNLTCVATCPSTTDRVISYSIVSRDFWSFTKCKHRSMNQKHGKIWYVCVATAFLAVTVLYRKSMVSTRNLGDVIKPVE